MATLAAVSLLVACSVPDGGTTDAEASTSVTVSADWAIFDGPADLAARSDVVVRGAIGQEFARYPFFEPNVDEAPALIDILHYVKVEEIVAVRKNLAEPPAVGDTILVSYVDLLGGPTDNITPFIPGEQLVMFLVAATYTSPGLDDAKGWEPLASDSGIFEIDSDDVVARTSVGPMKGMRIPQSELESVVLAVPGFVGADGPSN